MDHCCSSLPAVTRTATLLIFIRNYVCAQREGRRGLRSGPVLADPGGQRQAVGLDPAGAAVRASEQSRRVVRVKQPAVEQAGKPGPERLEAQPRGFREMVGDQGHPGARPGRRVAFRVAMLGGQPAQAGLGVADRLILTVSADVKPGHPQMVTVTEAMVM